MGGLQPYASGSPQLLTKEGRRKTGRLGCVLGLWLGLAFAGRLPAAAVPGGFTDSLVAGGITGPTAMEFAPDGRLFVCQKAGQLRIIKNGALLPAPFMTLVVETLSERGLLGVTFDPGFSTNHFLYAYYTASAPSVHNRVSRFTANGDTVVPGSELILLDLNTLGASDHNGGAIHFGADGKLYIAAGDNTVSANAQSLGNLLGKISRINATGTIPTDNPFYNTASGNNRAIWALGFRNPFTFAFQPGTGRLFINDVGFATWDEINEGMAGANYGWPTCEGACSPANGFKNPLFQYGHTGGSTNVTGCAIVGGAFYNPATNNFPLQYLGSYFFADYCNGWIRRLDPAGSNAVSLFATGIASPVDLKVGTDGCLYYLARGDNSVYKIQSLINPPNITAHPANYTVTEGLTAAFTVGASGAEPLAYQWQRNGTNVTGAASNVLTLGTVMLTDSGASFRCVVTNLYGSITSNPALLLVTTNHDPVPLITLPAIGTMYSAGDTITFEGTGTDPEEGGLPPGAFSWMIVFHHDYHTHPFLGPIEGVTNGTFVIPTQGETSANVAYRIELTVTDGLGRSGTTYRDITPRTSVITLATSPPGLQLTLDGQPLIAPAADVSVIGLNRSLGAMSPQTLGGTTYVFVAWSDGGAAEHDIAMPATNTTYTAFFLAAPFVITPPVSQIVTQEATVTFEAQAGGAGPLHFQWQRNGLHLDGATNGTLTLPHVQPADAGDYSVQISNAVGVTSSDVATLTVLVPPVILTQPAHLTVTNGDTALFTADASGTAPLQYQWFFNITNPLENATNTTLSVTNCQPSHAGGYSVQVANGVGANTSAVATLTVLVPPSIVTQPQPVAVTNGGDAVFVVAAGGTSPLTFQWFFEGTNLLAGETGSILTIADVSPATAGTYSVRVGNAAGSVMSDPTLLIVLLPPSILAQPQPAATTNEGTGSFHVTASGTAPLRYEWRFNDGDLEAQTNDTLVLSGVSILQEGNYTVVITNDYGAVTSAVATLRVEAAPLIVSQPQSLTVTNGDAALFAVAALGTAPLRYQWFFGGTNPLAAETNATLLLPVASLAHLGDYSVRVSNAVGVAVSDTATLTVLSPPIITAPPQSQIATNGDATLFAIAVEGTSPLLYQWRFNDADLADRTNSTLTIPTVTGADEGNYSVAIANDFGAVTSSVATLTVLFPPTITIQPQSVTVANGSAAAFTVAAGGTAPLHYQWFFGTNMLAAETNATLLLPTATLVHMGDYSVRVSNAVGVALSDIASLTVLSPPVITSPPQSLTATNGDAALFAVAAEGTAPLLYQWRFNNADLADRTNDTLTLSTVTGLDDGSYSVVVANAFGSVTSSVATLTVLFPPSITAQPENATATNGGTATFTVETAGTSPLRYQWFFQSTNLLTGETDNTLWITPVTAAHAGAYSVRVSNSAGTILSDAATLTVLLPPTITAHPQSLSVTDDSPATFTITVTGTSPFTYRWLRNGSDLANEFGSSLTLNNVTTNDTGDYTAVVANSYGEITSAVATLTVLPSLSITTPPESLTLTNGGTGILSVVAAGRAPIHYQWLFQGTNLLTGETNALFTITNALPGHAGSYRVRVSNAAGELTSAPATLTVLIPPSITAQPQSVTATNGDAVIFAVTALGTEPLAYQWRFNGGDLDGQTNLALTLNGVGPLHAGDYTVLVANPYGAVTSAVATLTVLVRPGILQPPSSLTITQGQAASFTVTAEGTAPLRFQWFRHGTNLLAGETNSALTISAAQLADVGAYTVTVANDVGAITSSVAVLTLAAVSSGLPARAALQFDGADDYVEIPDNPSLTITGPITVEAWIRRDAMGVQHSVAEKYGCAGSGGYVLRVAATDKLMFGTRDDCNNGSSVTGVTTLLSNTWYHVAGTWDGVTLQVFVNGGADAPPFPTTRNPKPGATPLRIGARGNDLVTPFRGVIDEVRVWNLARTAAEIRARMFRRLAGDEAGLAGCWHFDEGVGIATSDSTIHTNTGALTNGPVWVPSTAPLGLPGIVATAVTNIAPTSAALDAVVALNTPSVSAFFQWGTNDLYGQLTPTATLTDSPGETATLAGTLIALTPGVTYHFRAVVFNEVGTNFSPDLAFTTPGPPAVATFPAFNITSDSATLAGEVNPHSLTTTAAFEWGATTNYGNTTPSQFLSGATLVAVSASLNGLTPGETYHCRFVAYNEGGTNYGADEAFSTHGFPLVTTLAADGIATDSATLQAAVQPNGSATLAFFQWGLTVNYTDATPAQDAGSGLTPILITNHVATWQPGTVYHFRAAASNRFGLVFGADQLVATLPGAGESALLFDGLNDQVLVPDAASLRITGPITVEAWIRRSVMGVQHAVVEKYGCLGDAALVGGYVLRVNADDKLVFRTEDDCSNGTSAIGATSLQSNVWYHVAGLWDGSQIRVYINGALDGVTATTRNPKTGFTPLRIGERGNTLQPMAGAIDEVRLWNVARTQAELQAHLSRRLTGNEPGLAAYWRFDEGTGLTADDATGHGNTGALLDGPVWITGLNFSGPPQSLPHLAITPNRTNNTVTLRLTGIYGTTLILETSTNLPAWAPLTNYPSITGSIDHTAPLTVNPRTRFYRVRQTQ